jgi:homopolymeric O-antigen transport system ATP-binding protein
MRSEVMSGEMAPESQQGEVILAVEQVSKKFCRSLKRSLYYGVRDIAKELIGGKRKSDTLRKGEFWALQDVSFSMRRGESLALVGANGAGKTTLFRIISGLIKPDTGSVKVKGKVAPLIALGAGFSPILSGRENVYVNMAILGLSKKDIDERFQDVVDFAEIGEAIDAPVQTYSSGMAARLGFACAVHTEPDILLIDEVLAVGDLKFRAKCYRRLAELRKKGTSFVVVSHNPATALSICNAGIYLSKGRLIMTGDTEAIMKQYEEDLSLNVAEKAVGEVFLPVNEAASDLLITHIRFKDHNGSTLEPSMSGKPAYISVGCKAYESFSDVSLVVIIREMSLENSNALILESARDNMTFQITPGEFEVQLHMPYLGLRPGTYSLKVYLTSEFSFNILDVVEGFVFRVQADNNMSQCLFYQPRSWEIVQLQNHG